MKLLMLFIFAAVPIVAVGQKTEPAPLPAEEHAGEEQQLSAQQLKEFSIELAQVASGVIHKKLQLSGEIVALPQRLHHISPQVTGTVRSVHKRLGDSVKKGDLLAIIVSRDLADAKAQFVAASSLLDLANATLSREKSLYEQQISAKRDYLVAKQAQAQMLAKYQAAKQHLLALGLSEADIATTATQQTGLYKLLAPADGIIISQHLAQGEIFAGNENSFTVADLSKVWVNLTVYPADISSLAKGQQVAVHSRFGATTAPEFGQIDSISPTLDHKTRSAAARVTINNPHGYWRPGLFVRAVVTIASTTATMVVSQSALQTVNGETVVFVQHEEGEFAAQDVQIGMQDRQYAEVLHGLKLGQTYVSQNAFALKAQLQKGEFGDGHNH